MALVASEVETRVRLAVQILRRHADIAAVFLFGSHVSGSARESSDIDVGVFAKGTREWNIENVAGWVAEAQKLAGDDIEIHFFPAESLANPARGSFAEHVMANGVRVE